VGVITRRASGTTAEFPRFPVKLVSTIELPGGIGKMKRQSVMFLWTRLS
jgi:hypothetical protein